MEIEACQKLQKLVLNPIKISKKEFYIQKSNNKIKYIFSYNKNTELVDLDIIIYDNEWNEIKFEDASYGQQQFMIEEPGRLLLKIL